MAKLGWIRIHRQIVDSDIYQMPPLYLRVFERLLIEANHQDNEIPYKERGSKVVGKKLIRRGERLTSIRDICRWVAWYERGKEIIPNPKTIQNILDWLEENDMIEIYGVKGNRKETYYKVENYNDYQEKESKEVTEKQQSADTQADRTLDTNKNVKNVKNDKKLNNNIISRPETPYKEIVNLYNTICISFNSIKQITDKRKGNINARYQESKCSIEVFKILFTKMQDSNFLKGGWDSGGKADFDWVMRPTNFVKVLEGKYDNKNQKQQTGNKQSNLSELMEMIEGGVFDE